MTGFALLDVAIGVIFAFLTFSLVATSMQEALASIFNWRGRMLRRGFFRLLESGAKSDALIGKTFVLGAVKKAELTVDLLNDPSMRSLQGSKSFLGRLWTWLEARLHRNFSGNPKRYERAKTKFKNLKLDAKTTFDQAMDDAFKGVSTDPTFEELLKEQQLLDGGETERARRYMSMGRMPTNVPKETFGKALLDTLYRKIEKRVQAEVTTLKENAKATVADVKTRVNEALDRAAADAQAAHDAAADAADAAATEDDPMTLSDDARREVMGLLAPKAEAAKAFAASVAGAVDGTLDEADRLIKDLPMDDGLKKRIRQALKSMAVSKALQEEFDAVQQSIEETVEGVTDLIKDLEAEVAKVTAEIGDWFDQGMDRVTGWYVRRAKYVLFVIGFFMAMMVNFDIIGYSDQLLKDDDLRKQIVEQAEATVEAEAVGKLQVESKTDLIFAVLLINTDDREKPEITSDEVWENFDKIPEGARLQLGLGANEKPEDATEQEEKKKALQPALDAAAITLTEVAKTMVGAFPTAKDGKEITDEDRQAAANAYVKQLEKTYKDSIGLLQTQFADRGVTMGRTCPVSTETAVDNLKEPSLGVKLAGALADETGLYHAWTQGFLKSTRAALWEDSIAQCIRHSWEWRGFISWLIIAFGCTLGGQFWFDMLKNLLKVRTAASGISTDLKKILGPDKGSDPGSGQNGSQAPNTN